MKLIEVQTEKHHRQFVDLPQTLYKDVPQYIPPIRKDVEQVFDRRENTTFSRGDCLRWIVIDKQKVVGRIAAFWVRGRPAPAPCQAGYSAKINKQNNKM